MDESLYKKLVEDLQKSGFGSEMKAIQTFIDCGWDCTAGSTYEDPVTSDQREIDIFATLLFNERNDNGDRFGAWTFIVAEVKKSEKPWVIFRQAPSSFPDLFLKQPRLIHLFQGANRGLMEQKLSKAIESNSIARECGWVGYGIHESFKNPSHKSRWYSACTKVLNAAKYKLDLEKPDEDHKVLNQEKKFRWYRYVQVRPVIVLDGILVSARLSEEGIPVLEETDVAALDFSFASHEMLSSNYRVDIVTLNALPKYLDRCQDQLALIARELQQIALS